MKTLLSIGLLCCMFVQLSAQTNPGHEAFELQEFVEQIAGPPDPEQENQEALYENLLLQYESPLDLNRVGAEDLQQLGLLSSQQIESLIEHRKRTGPLLSVYELQAVAGFDLSSIRRLLPFVQINPQRSFRRFSDYLGDVPRYLIMRWERTLPLAQGFQPQDSLPPHYPGSADRLLLRFRTFKSQSFSAGFSLEKDAGEMLSWQPQNQQYGFDYLSGHLSLQGKGKLRQLMLGDYWLQHGQGLVFGRGIALGRGAEPVATLSRGGSLMQPHTATLEAGFLRGIALQLGFGSWSFTPFLSHQKQNARLYSFPDDSSSFYFRSLREDGYHRTASELAVRKQVRQSDWGFILQHARTGSLSRWGISLMQNHFSHPWQADNQLYNQQAFRGRSNMVASLFGETTLSNVHVFGELARSQSGGWAGIGGLQTSLSPRFDLALSVRHYEANFHSLYARAFAESSSIRNEQGLYLGTKVYLPHKLTFSAYYDLFRFPAARFRLSQAGSFGHEGLLRVSWQPRRSMQLYFQFQQEEKERNLSLESPTPYIITGMRSQYLLHASKTLNDRWAVQGRLQLSRYASDSSLSRGKLVYAEARYTQFRLRLSARLGYFHSDDYDSRLYAYERNVLWAFSFPALSGQGIRTYVLSQYKLSPQLSIWMRWALSRYLDRSEIRSGPDTISGRNLHQLTAQIKWDF